MPLLIGLCLNDSVDKMTFQYRLGRKISYAHWDVVYEDPYDQYDGAMDEVYEFVDGKAYYGSYKNIKSCDVRDIRQIVSLVDDAIKFELHVINSPLSDVKYYTVDGIIINYMLNNFDKPMTSDGIGVILEKYSSHFEKLQPIRDEDAHEVEFIDTQEIYIKNDDGTIETLYEHAKVFDMLGKIFNVDTNILIGDGDITQFVCSCQDPNAQHECDMNHILARLDKFKIKYSLDNTYDGARIAKFQNKSLHVSWCY